MTATEEASIKEVAIVGLDLAKNMFQAHGMRLDGGARSEQNCPARRSWSFSRLSRTALLRWKLAPVRITGVEF